MKHLIFIAAMLATPAMAIDAPEPDPPAEPGAPGAEASADGKDCYSDPEWAKRQRKCQKERQIKRTISDQRLGGKL